MDSRTLASLIIPTHHRSPMLVETVSLLRDLEYPAELLELIIVTDRLETGIQQAVAGMKLPFPYQIAEQPGQGAAIRRNRGAALARGDLLIFIDDDMSASPQLVCAHANAHGQEINRVVLGYFPPLPPGEVGFLQLELRDWWETYFYQQREAGHRFSYQDLSAGNFSLRQDLFRQTGGFREDFICREDHEFGVRLLAAGARFVFCEAARCDHRDRTGIEHALRRKMQEGEADVQLGQIHPQLRKQTLAANLLAYSTLAGNGFRYLAFRWPLLGDRLAGLVRRLLVPAEKMRLWHLWRRLQLGLSFYAYWRGVATQLPDVGAVRAFLNHPVEEDLEERELLLELSDGFEVAEQAIDAALPDCVKLHFHDLPLGMIPASPGAERLQGIHLRPYLANHLFLSLAQTLARMQAAGLPALKTGQAAVYPGEGIQVMELASELPVNPTPTVTSSSNRTLLRFQGRPLGWVEPADFSRPPDPTRLNENQVYDWLLPSLFGIGKLPGTADPDSVPAITVVVCTRNRPHMLDGCLRSLLDQNYPHFEILVIDNAPTAEETRQLCSQFPVGYYCEERPGLDIARNTGWQLAGSSLVAYTDDDARPDPGWLNALAAAFGSPGVAAVTGPVLPWELVTPAQIAFEEGYGGMSHGFYYRRFQRTSLTNAQLLWASGFGVGANMAIRREILVELGGFDPKLDVGTPAAGGGDVEFFHRLVARGYSLVHTPAAVVWHQHRRDWAGLRKQIFNNGRSFGAYLLTCWRKRTVSRGSILWFTALEWMGKWLVWRLVRPGNWPRSLVLVEIMGALTSPAAYALSRLKSLPEEKRQEKPPLSGDNS